MFRLERIPIGLNRNALQILALARVLFGKPVSTFPGHALAAVAAALWLSVTGLAQAQGKPPEETIKAIYAFYNGADSKGFPGDAKTAARFFEPGLARLWTRAKNIDADFFIQGQDFELGPVTTGAARVQGKRAFVPVSFTNFKKPVSLEFEMIEGPEGWRVYNVKAGKATLRDSLAKAR
jgi:hypothetical protein